MPPSPAPHHRITSTLQLPPGAWPTVLDCLCEHFAHISREQWLSRMSRGLVRDVQGQTLSALTPYRHGLIIQYFREIEAEQRIPFTESIIYADKHLVVADKPHFLPVTPKGRYVQETLLSRLMQRLDNPQLAPLHRLDRGTAGLVMFSTNPEHRAKYHALFSEHRITKHYQAIAAPLSMHTFPLIHRSRLVTGEPFFRMHEAAGIANTETHIDVLERGSKYWRYSLSPLTGKKHQLRVHMAALGASIVNDDFYPALLQRADDDYSQPLQLLATRLNFIDPVSGDNMLFESRLCLGGCE
jgi:tRNA pseudouridine32 synthase / 23S rRNA pseudouridine746 synthase